MDSLNHTLFLLINADPDTALWAVDAGRLLAKRVIYIIPLMLVGMWLWGDSTSRQTALKAFTVTAVALGCNHAIGMVVHTPRPFELGLGYTFLAHAPTASFPSNHLTIFFSIGLTLFLSASAKMGMTIIVMGVIVAWARIFIGVHFPLDMVGAVVVSGVIYALVTPVWQRYGITITTHAEQLYRRILAIPIKAGWLRY